MISDFLMNRSGILFVFEHGAGVPDLYKNSEVTAVLLLSDW